MNRLIFVLSFLLLCVSVAAGGQGQDTTVFQAGAATSNITPRIGTSINGSMQDIFIKNIHDETHARALVLDDGTTQLAFAALDLCMVSREILDKAKKRAHEFTGIPIENMMMSATHTHSAGTVCGVFQSDPDPAYMEFVAERAADAIIRAYHNREAASIAWGVGHEPNEVFNRRWHMKPGTSIPNPFGGQDQVKMNPGVGNPTMLEPAGPVDSEVPTILLQTLEGEPIAVLSNYSLHYVGGTGRGEVSADYFGLFAERVGVLLEAVDTPHRPPFVGIMTNGTSGDINNIHWAGEPREPLPAYAKMQQVANNVAMASYESVKDQPLRAKVSLSAKQSEIRLAVRKPEEKEIERAREIVRNAEGSVMKSMEEIYARETLLLDDYPDEVDILLQVFRIGEIAIAAIPAEVFVEIGLELKSKSPFKPTFTISLANGYNGYLPTPQHHRLGGYETWRARSSYLEVHASDKILETLMSLLVQHDEEKE